MWVASSRGPATFFTENDMNQHHIRDGIHATVERNRQRLLDLSDYLFDTPELGNHEFKAHAAITAVLRENGFLVDDQVLGLDTAFRATCVFGAGGPRIGLLCEYDALKDMGHACGHQMQAPAILGAALALKEHLVGQNATLVIYGTPAEETTSAKLPMAKQGIFDDLDVAIMMHAGDRTTVDGKSLALNLVDFIFHGKASHAAIAPEKGISALDAVLMMFNGVEYLREHVRQDVRMHGVITDGGKVANIVPERASAQFYIRANDRPYLDQVVERVYNVARGAALATGATLEINEVKAYDNKLNVETLNALLLDEAAAAGAPMITPPRQFTGSTDFSCVSYRVPGACLRVSFVPLDVPSHSQVWLNEGKSESAHAAVITAAKAIACACYRLAADAETFNAIRERFAAAKAAPSRP